MSPGYPQEIKEFADPMRRCGRVEDGYRGKSRAGSKDVRPRVGVGVENVNRREKVYSARRMQRVERAMSAGDHGTDRRDSSENTANDIAPQNQGKRAEKIEIWKLEMDLLDEIQKFAHTFDKLDHESSHHASLISAHSSCRRTQEALTALRDIVTTKV